MMSLREIDPVEDLLARLRLDREAREAGAVIVEGPTDERILARTLRLNRRALFPSAGRVNLLRCASALQQNPLEGVICVGDRDFDSACTDWSDCWFLVFYDNADVEAMAVDSPALDRMLEEWASQRKLERVGGSAGVRQLLFERTRPLSKLRAASARDGLGLKFDSFALEDVLEKRTAEVKINALLGRLATPHIPRERLETILGQDEPRCPDTERPLARGRDLLAFLSTMLRQLVGSLSRQQARGDFAERTMRLALLEGDFDETLFHLRFTEAIRKAKARFADAERADTRT